MNPEMREGWKKEFRSIKKTLPGSTGKALPGSAKTFQGPRIPSRVREDLPGSAKTFQGPQDLEESWRNNNTQR